MQIQKTKTVNIILSLGILILALAVVSADSYSLYCIDKGKQVDFGALCNPDMGAKSGPTMICVHTLDNGKICPTTLNTCNSLDLKCDSSGGVGDLDTEAPIITLTSPKNKALFQSKSIPFSVSLNEFGDIYYTDAINGRGRWSKICTNCKTSNSKRSFNEGLNNITIRAKDVNGNAAFLDTSFFIDSKAPKISKTLPKKDFANGVFEILLKEQNPTSLILSYGNNKTGIKTKAINLGNDCLSDREKYSCVGNVSLASYDGQVISYWFTLKDIAGSTVNSNKIFLAVDTKAPVFSNINTTLKGRSVIFEILINETNFDNIEYIDIGSDRPTWRTLCSSLKNGICKSSKSFSVGEHEIVLRATDEAGNYAEKTIQLQL